MRIPSLPAVALGLVVALSSLFGAPYSLWAFYSSATVNNSFTLEGFVSSGGSVSKYPGDGFPSEDASEAEWFGDLRLLADAGIGDNWAVIVNILQSVRSSPVSLFAGSVHSANDVERSGMFFQEQHASENTRAIMVLDAAYIKYGNVSHEFTAGRQPVTTSVTFFFTPNDFFAPFSAATFFKVYKPGVDALRYERRIAELSQLSVIGVLGYEPDSFSGSGWSNSPDWHRSSLVARVTHAVGEFEFGGLCGVVRESMITGFSVQGEFLEWLGVRAEGHYAKSWADGRENGLEAAVSFEHRFANSLTARFEHLYNSYGSDSIAESLADRMQGRGGDGYLGRNYSAVDLGYELSPLIYGEVQYLRNWSDDSYLLSFYTVYSVSDEADISLTASFPGGSEPGPAEILSELGSLPVQFSLEFRWYF